jgi:hypothetical protein
MPKKKRYRVSGCAELVVDGATSKDQARAIATQILTARLSTASRHLPSGAIVRLMRRDEDTRILPYVTSIHVAVPVILEDNEDER